MKILLLTLLLPLYSYAGMMSFSVSPGVIKYETVQGGIKVFDLTFFNQGKDKLSANVEILDLRLDAQGVPVFSELSKQGDQWGRFVQIDRKIFTVDSNKSQKIHVTLRTPRGVSGGGYFAVVFNASAPKSSTSSKQKKNVMSIGGQLPVLFIGEVGRTGQKKITSLKGAINKSPYTKDKPFKLRFTIKNSGNTHLNVEGDVLLRHNKKVIKRIKLESGSGLIFPKGHRYFVATWHDIARFSNKKIQAEARFSHKGGRLVKKINFKTP